MRRCIVWMLIIVLTVSIMAVLHKYGTNERGFPALGGEALLPAIPLVAAAIFYDEKKQRKNQLSEKRAGTNKEENRMRAILGIKSHGDWFYLITNITSESELMEKQQDPDFCRVILDDFLWNPIKSKQELLELSNKTGYPLYIISPSGLAKYTHNQLIINARPEGSNESVFYMKGKDLTDNGDGTSDWGGIRVSVKLEAGVVTQQEALEHLGKQKLLEILGLGNFTDDIEFVSKEEYERDFAHEA